MNSRLTLRLLVLLLLCVGLAHAQQPVDLPQVTGPPLETAPLDGRVFCVFGDTQTAGQPSRLRITATIAAAMADEHPDFVIGTGDFIDGASTAERVRAQYDAFFQALLPLQKHGPVPLAAAAGNHDTAGGIGSLWEQYFGRRYHSFDLGRAHFIILDTQQPNQYGRIDGVQYQWLVDDLAAAKDATMIFVALHQPLFPVSVHRGSAQDKYPKQRDRLHMLLAKSRVSAVFSGHEHLYHHHERDGVHYFINGGGGAPLYASEAKGGFYHYLRVQYTDADYTVEVKRVSAQQ